MCRGLNTLFDGVVDILQRQGLGLSGEWLRCSVCDVHKIRSRLHKCVICDLCMLCMCVWDSLGVSTATTDDSDWGNEELRRCS